MSDGIVKIHGKEYKTVALRVAEFRAKHPDYTILTELVEANDVLVVMKATSTMLVSTLVLVTLTVRTKLKQRQAMTVKYGMLVLT